MVDFPNTCKVYSKKPTPTAMTPGSVWEISKRGGHRAKFPAVGTNLNGSRAAPSSAEGRIELSFILASSYGRCGPPDVHFCVVITCTLIAVVKVVLAALGRCCYLVMQGTNAAFPHEGGDIPSYFLPTSVALLVTVATPSPLGC